MSGFLGIRNYDRVSCCGHLSIDGFLLHGPAWVVPDCRPLWLEAAQRGSDLRVPGAAGVLARRRRRDVTTFPTRLLITADVNPAGEPVDFDQRPAQLYANLAAIQAAVVAPTGVDDGTRAATLTLPDDAATVLNADVHVQGLSISNESERHLDCVLDLSFPLGRFS